MNDDERDTRQLDLWGAPLPRKPKRKTQPKPPEEPASTPEESTAAIPLTDAEQLAEAIEARDEAIERVEQSHDDWVGQAIIIIYQLCKEQDEFTSDDLWTTLDPPAEPRALGAAMRLVKKLRYCDPTGDTKQSRRKTCHARPLRVWRSLLRTGGQQ